MPRQSETLRIGTRASRLALAQTGTVEHALQSALSDWKIRTVKIRTSGDRNRRKPLAAIGGEGLFTRELQQALLDERVDIAVHSLKDLPTERPDGLTIAAVPERADPRDVLISHGGAGLNTLPEGSVLGTGSARRRVQVLEIRPDLTIREIRGNVETRIRKVREGKYEATLLALAGLQRAKLENEADEIIPLDIVLPAAGQGALAIEMRTGDPRIETVTAILHHEPSAVAVDAERRVLAGLGGGCQVPLAVLCEIENDGNVRLRASLADEEGRDLRCAQASGPVDDLERVVGEVLECLTRSP